MTTRAERLEVSLVVRAALRQRDDVVDDRRGRAAESAPGGVLEHESTELAPRTAVASRGGRASLLVEPSAVLALVARTEAPVDPLGASGV